jgi:membrane-associated protein
MFGAGLTDFIITGGLFLIALTVYFECGFLIGFFLPGDTLLFLAGFLAGEGRHNIVVTSLVIFIAAVLGNITGYIIGRRAGPHVFTREDGILFQKKYILDAQIFYEKHGGKTLILARFIPFVRTFAPLIAGVAKMPFLRFFIYSSVGAFIWAVLIPGLGFWAYRVLGHTIDIEKFVLPIVLGVMVLSIGGSAFHALREAHKQRGRVKVSELTKNQAEVDQQID